MATETNTRRAHFLFSRGREMTFTVTGADEVTVYTGTTTAGSWGAGMGLVEMTLAAARIHYRAMVAKGWVAA